MSYFNFITLPANVNLLITWGIPHRIFTQIFLWLIIHYPIIILTCPVIFTFECTKTLVDSWLLWQAFSKNFQPRRIEYSNHQFINFFPGITLLPVWNNSPQGHEMDVLALMHWIVWHYKKPLYHLLSLFLLSDNVSTRYSCGAYFISWWKRDTKRFNSLIRSVRHVLSGPRSYSHQQYALSLILHTRRY